MNIIIGEGGRIISNRENDISSNNINLKRKKAELLLSLLKQINIEALVHELDIEIYLIIKIGKFLNYRVSVDEFEFNKELEQLLIQGKQASDKIEFIDNKLMNIFNIRTVVDES